MLVVVIQKSRPGTSQYKMMLTTMAFLTARNRVPEEQIRPMMGMVMAHPTANRKTSLRSTQRQMRMLPLSVSEECISPMFRQLTTPHRPIPPCISTMPFGFINFTITGITPGGAVTVQLYLPAGTTVDTYYKYGKTPDNAIPHWYEFLFDGTTGAEISENIITLHFVDGNRGDNDITANGIIIDPSGPGIDIRIPPTAAFSADPVSGTAPLLVQFTDASTGTAPLTYAWDFNNDGLTDNTTQSPSYTYATAGTYTVNLTVTNEAGSDFEVKTGHITVNAPLIAPTAAFSSDVQTGTAPLTVTFTDASTGTGPLTYAWDFNNDGTIDSTVQNPAYVYSIAGTYSVNLSVTGPGGSDSELKTGYITVTVKPPVPVKPVAAFSATPTSGYAPLTSNSPISPRIPRRHGSGSIRKDRAAGRSSRLHRARPTLSRRQALTVSG